MSAEMELYHKGIFTFLEWWQKCIRLGRNFSEKWIQVTDLTHMWCVPVHTFVKLPYDFQYGPHEVTSDIHRDTDDGMDVCVKTGV